MQCSHEKPRGTIYIRSARPKTSIISITAVHRGEAAYPQSLEYCPDCGATFVPAAYLPKPAEVPRNG